jgi:hypothetical protein
METATAAGTVYNPRMHVGAVVETALEMKHLNQIGGFVGNCEVGSFAGRSGVEQIS